MLSEFEIQVIQSRKIRVDDLETAYLLAELWMLDQKGSGYSVLLIDEV